MDMFFNKKIAVFLLISFNLLFLNACQENTTQTKVETFTVVAKTNVTKLYFNGKIKPLRVVTITSPVEGTVEKLFFRYGADVTKDQLLMTIISNSFQKNYQDAVTGYLTADQKNTNAKMTMDSSQFLFDKGLISRDDYFNTKTQLQDAQLGLIQARIQLENVLKIAQIPVKDIKLLKVGNTKAIEEEFAKPISNININATASGIALLPDKEGSSSGAGQEEIRVGTQVKTGQALASIGDLSGLMVQIAVDEITINQIKTGLPVTITSPAFPTLDIKGSIKEINSQADIRQGGGMSSFDVQIVVPKLTKAERHQIHVGMSSTVEIILTKASTISVPISAVYEKDGNNFVDVIDKNGKTTAKMVDTGKTTLTDVEILSGLKPGDTVVIGH